jgi:hypothetical protein
VSEEGHLCREVRDIMRRADGVIGIPMPGWGHKKRNPDLVATDARIAGSDLPISASGTGRAKLGCIASEGEAPFFYIRE